ncbi:hypothetical protein HanXRQr2_Chr03g0094821 [Helianthus annuus]|uniref:Secreted protein n=1 Tax=Helianthus annuus TaxID=4232 RepID=A0A9K3JEE6_HELAN|nr:hypothetical protein HanXRQr2_Chr03g0094821 [Helianthus annuus]KAJ0591953.1 hypothetical protein HanHA300_Chr03g0079251 [Helianthus annuus]KAJ0599325.1 hypothetical protein HanIR_Chr03g0103581 [Helianthus annuus]KAJ0606924.1 hypothetical protein HanHA89_Chr03g0090601 [Helianthus annuus]KAJ0766990.1 hypothetical protein HanLR1_Chr03g0083921 [Helianthus annuus]
MVAMVQVVVACVAWVLTALSIPPTTSENERHKQIPLGFRRDFWYMVVTICNYTFFNSSVSLLLRPHLLTLQSPKSSIKFLNLQVNLMI